MAISAGLIVGIAFAGTAHAEKDPQSAWVKLCEKATLPAVDKAGKPKKIIRNICLTHHERLDGNTGMVIISAAIRQIEGEKKQSLMIMVPLGMALQPGMKAAVYTKEQWARAKNKERVADDELKPLSLEYGLCHAAGCTAEIEVPDGLIDSMIKGGGLMVLSRDAGGQSVAFPIPLIGFEKAHNGAPVDNAKYTQARRQLMSAIRERMRARIAKRSAEGASPKKTE